MRHVRRDRLLSQWIYRLSGDSLGALALLQRSQLTGILLKTCRRNHVALLLTGPNRYIADGAFTQSLIDTGSVFRYINIKLRSDSCWPRIGLAMMRGSSPLWLQCSIVTHRPACSSTFNARRRKVKRWLILRPLSGA